MSSTYSVINDLYGVEPASQRPERQGSLGLVIVMILAGMFIYASVHPVMRLRSSPPPVFLKSTAKLKTIRLTNQEHIARSYWGLAADTVSGKYSYGQLLPSNPPEDFTIATGKDYATRSLYWERLRETWNQPDNWVRSYQFDTDWIDSTVDSLGKAVKNYLNT